MECTALLLWTTHKWPKAMDFLHPVSGTVRAGRRHRATTNTTTVPRVKSVVHKLSIHICEHGTRSLQRLVHVAHAGWSRRESNVSRFESRMWRKCALQHKDSPRFGSRMWWKCALQFKGHVPETVGKLPTQHHENWDGGKMQNAQSKTRPSRLR
jgi:hypothetical protein